jgi:hypothetical protein
LSDKTQKTTQTVAFNQEAPIYIQTRNPKDRKQHWKRCEKQQIPFIAIQRSAKSSMIDWDLWNINVFRLCLSDQAAEQLYSYGDELFNRRVCYTMIKGNPNTGYLRVKRSVEAEVLAFLWKIIGNPKNWMIEHSPHPLYDLPFKTMLEESEAWLKKRQDAAAA